VGRLLRQRLRLAGQQRLVDFEPAGQHRPVDDDLRAGRQPPHVPAHHLLRRHLGVDAVAQHGDRAARQQLQPVERALGPDLLHHADAGVDQAQAPAGERLAVPAVPRRW
jgi:hypothetical protein